MNDLSPLSCAKMPGPPDASGRRRTKLLQILAFCAGCTALNVAGNRLCELLSLPLYLDSIGTMLAAAAGGYLPGMMVGYLTNLFCGFFNPSASYFGAINVLLAAAAAFCAKKDCFRRPLLLPIPILLTSLIGGGIGSVLAWCLSGFSFGDPSSATLAQRLYSSGLGAFPALLVSGCASNLIDKGISVLLTVLLLRLLPRNLTNLFRLETLINLPEDLRETALDAPCRSVSLRAKVLLLIGAAGAAISISAISISAVLYRQTTIEEHMKLAQGVASLAASSIHPDRVDEYLALGRDAPGYLEAEERLYAVRDSTPDIQYLYFYQIQPDGCHVVFDLDTEELEGMEPGEIVPFDESFAEYLPTLLAGGAIDPIITNDTYGWLLTAYLPVYNSAGRCVCYACTDISMGQVTAAQIAFVSRETSLFLGFFLVILCAGVLIATYNLVLPVNAIAAAAGAFAYNSTDARAQSLQSIHALRIHTGDEIENLYLALSKTTEDTMAYIADVQNKAETILKMQNGLILVLAEIVESRDRNTGDHVRKTAMYVRIIVEQMRREGLHPETLTDQYIDLIANAAPLHDIGKIHVPDAVLNKPGRLTDEEFREMKDHTTEGKEIITRAIRLVPDSGYLNEARNMAAYHHERWDGKGYPNGLAGEAIPLSARIMAVADVFDALVSRRSYKKGFPFEQAVDIIRDGAGTHFDPQVAGAFLHAEAEVRQVAEAFREIYEGEPEAAGTYEL